MLRHLGLGFFAGRIFSRCRSSIISLRLSHHHVPSSGPSPEPSDLPPAAAQDPPADWVMLNKHGIRADESFVADANTVAYYGPVFTGRDLRVSLGRSPPPASTFIYYDFPDSAPGEDNDSSDSPCDEDDNKVDENCKEEDDNVSKESDDVDESEEEEDIDVDEWGIIVITANCDSVLLKLSHRRHPSDYESMHLLYRVASTARPPSLALLPERDFLTKSEQICRHQYGFPPKSGDTGLLRQGDSDDVIVVQLDHLYDRNLKQYMAEFCLFRHGATQWELKEPVPIIVDEGSTERPQTRGGGYTMVTPGNRFLCWVTYKTGFVLCDMADEESPKVRYVPLPPGVCWDPKEYDDGMPKYSMNMGAAGPSAVRFVSIDPHCCCGGPGRSTCVRSRYAFTINTWTMNLSMDGPLMWVKDGEIDCEQLWGQPGYEGVPQVNLQYPIVSLDDPNIVCFLVANRPFVSGYEHRKVWMIQLNIKTKALLSVVEYTNDLWGACRHLPAHMQSYPR